jgi:hypothetical protein
MNHVSNLEWNTRKENLQHAHKTGLMDYMNVNFSKTSRNEAIFKLKEIGFTNKKLSEAFGCSPENIIAILKRHSGKDFEKEQEFRNDPERFKPRLGQQEPA